jgi:hypothetical protein
MFRPSNSLNFYSSSLIRSFKNERIRLRHTSCHDYEKSKTITNTGSTQCWCFSLPKIMKHCAHFFQDYPNTKECVRNACKHFRHTCRHTLHYLCVQSTFSFSKYRVRWRRGKRISASPSMLCPRQTKPSHDPLQWASTDDPRYWIRETSGYCRLSVVNVYL